MKNIKSSPVFKNSFYAYFLVITFAIIFGACAKKEIQGPKGDPGTPGNGGNTNISSSDVFVIGSTQWQPSSADSSLWQVTYNSALITKDVVAKGSVKLYLQIGTAWFELPYINADLYTQFGYSEGQLKLVYSDIHGEKISAPALANYRLVVLNQSSRPLLPNPQGQNNRLLKTESSGLGN